MDHDALYAQSILAHQLTPALVLDSTGTVIAANSGSFRLLALSHLTTSSTTQNSLIGTNISDLGLAPLPGGQSPALWSWNELLGAAINCTRSTDSIAPDGQDTYLANAAIVEQDTDHFWNKEAIKQAVVETDIYVTRQSSEKLGGLQHVSEDVSHDAYESVETSSMIKARANIHWISQGLDGTFLITLNRASLPYRPQTPGGIYGASTNQFLGALESTALFSCCSCDKPIEKSYLKLSPDLEGLIPSASDISSAIIPYIMATLNTEGQVINLSKSWYQFSGLDEEESLGNGWLAAMHTDDLAGVTQSWAEVLQNKSSHWTHQARYRKASDGQYYWFLIRAQPYKTASGKVVRWYASMMDINEWVIARIESDRNRQAMLALFSQTDVMLWGIDENVRMYVCEGRLDWDPSKIEKLARTAQTHRSADDKGHEELIHTVQAVLQNKDFRPVIEHWEGHRYFRTRFIAERDEPGGSVKSALALTFDITDEKSRRTLRAENQRLVNNEKVALESNKLKSRFLANVSYTPPHGHTRED
jgi:PAS domain S-box-containing protein